MSLHYQLPRMLAALSRRSVCGEDGAGVVSHLHMAIRALRVNAMGPNYGGVAAWGNISDSAADVAGFAWSWCFVRDLLDAALRWSGHARGVKSQSGAAMMQPDASIVTRAE